MLRAVLQKIRHERDLELQVVWNNSSNVDLSPLTEIQFEEAES
jgi:hypothetical protein